MRSFPSGLEALSGVVTAVFDIGDVARDSFRSIPKVMGKGWGEIERDCKGEVGGLVAFRRRVGVGDEGERGESASIDGRVGIGAFESGANGGFGVAEG